MTDDLPFNRDAEACLLGAILLDPTVGWAIRTRLRPEDFYDPWHRQVFEAAMQALDGGQQPDLVTVPPLILAKSDRSGQEVVELLVALMDSVPDATHHEDHAALVRAVAHRRRMIEAGDAGVALLRADLGATDAGVTKVAQLWGKAVAANVGGTVHESGELLAQFNEYLAAPKAGRGPSTGFPELDEVGVSLAPGSMTILAGRPSMGKSALSNSMIASLGMKRKIPTLLCTLEVDGTMVTENLLCGASGTPHDEVRLQGEKLRVAGLAFAESPIFVNDSSLGIDDVRALTRMAVGKWGIQVMVLDYLQLLRRNTGKSSREREVAEQSAMLKEIARENNIAVLVLAQLNREVESREVKIDGEKVRGMPRLSDLRESGAIEQDADCVLLLYRSAYYADAEHIDTRRGQQTSVIVAKNRNGPTGRAKLMFYPRSTSFRSGLDLPDSPTESRRQAPYLAGD